MLKSIMRIIVALALISLLSWPILSEQRKQLINSLISGEVDWRQLVLVNPFSKQTIARAGPLVGAINQQIASTELGQELLANFHGEQQYRCEPISTRDIRDTDGKKMYRWQDEKGRWHFGDNKAATVPVEEVSGLYQSRYQYFKLALLGDDKLLPVFSRDKISAETKQIFSVLSDALVADYLRQVDLNIRLIASQTDFQRQRDSLAPSLKTNTGFYTTINNEAVIWLAPNADFVQAVIRHEASHVIMAGLYGYPPVWVNEGVAEYFEQLELSSNSKTVSPNDVWLRSLRQRDGLSLQEYFSLSPQQWRERPQEEMYSMAWGLVYFFMADQQNKNFFSNMLATMAKNKCQAFSTLDYVRAHYPQGLSGLQQQWQRWLGSRPGKHYY